MLPDPTDPSGYAPSKEDLQAIVDHESELACFFKRYSTFNVCLYIGWRLRNHSSALVLNVPHLAIRLIEASCRHQRDCRDKPYERKDHHKALNIVSQWNDPLLTHALERQQDIMLFGKIAEHQQLRLQLAQSRERHVIGRAVRLLRCQSMNRAWHVMQSHTGLNATSWLTMLIGGAGHCHQDAILNYNGYEKVLKDVPCGTYERFVNIVSYTPEEIRNRYIDLRERVRNPLYWSSIMPYIWTKPFINFGSRGLYSAVPAMIMRHAERGLAGVLSGRDGEIWDAGVSKALESYVEEQLTDCFGDSHVHRLDGNKLVSNATMLSDFVVDEPNSRIYIEVKSVRDRRMTFMPHELPSTRYTEQIRKAVEQVRTSATRNNEITRVLGLDASAKPIYGLILLQDDGVANNSPWYWKHALKMERGTPAGRDANGILEYPPQIASVDLLDVLGHILRNTDQAYSQLINEQEEKDRSLSYGDWIRELVDIRTDTPMELTRSETAMDEFIEEVRPMLE